MKTMLLGAVALQCAAGASAVTEHEVAFKFYKQQFNKVYSGEAEEAQRFAAFKASMTRVAASGNKAHGLTQFSDMTQAEFKQRMTARVQREETPTSTYQGECPACTRFPEVANLGKNTSWDWTQHGAVTAVKNQGQCGRYVFLPSFFSFAPRTHTHTTAATTHTHTHKPHPTPAAGASERRATSRERGSLRATS